MMALHFGQFLLLAQFCDESRETPLCRLSLPGALGVGHGAAVASFLLLFTAPKGLIAEFGAFYPTKWVPLGAIAVSFGVLWAAGSALFFRPEFGTLLLAGFVFLLGAARR